MKLEAWYLDRGSEEQGRAWVDEAFELLVGGIPPYRRRVAIRKLREFLVDLYDEMGVPIPPELAE